MYRKEFTMNKKIMPANFWCRQQSTLGVLIKSTIPPSGGFHPRRGYHSEIFGDAECEIIHFVNYEIFCLRRKWNKIRSSMCEAHFTLRSNISLPKAISQIPKGFISLQKTPMQSIGVFLLELLARFELATSSLPRMRSTDWAIAAYFVCVSRRQLPYYSVI